MTCLNQRRERRTGYSNASGQRGLQEWALANGALPMGTKLAAWAS